MWKNSDLESSANLKTMSCYKRQSKSAKNTRFACLGLCNCRPPHRCNQKSEGIPSWSMPVLWWSQTPELILCSRILPSPWEAAAGDLHFQTEKLIPWLLTPAVGKEIEFESDQRTSGSLSCFLVFLFPVVKKNFSFNAGLVPLVVRMTTSVAKKTEKLWKTWSYDLFADLLIFYLLQWSTSNFWFNSLYLILTLAVPLWLCYNAIASIYIILVFISLLQNLHSTIQYNEITVE